jgi:hypothetical protein
LPSDAASVREDIDIAAWRSATFRDKIQFNTKILRADLANFFLYQFRCVDGFLITGKNSGTHWLKFMLSCAIAHEFGVSPPRFSSGVEANAIIGHPSRPPMYAALPRIGSAHTIPSKAFAWRWLNRLAPHPPVVLLVRDIRSAMLSNYVKWKDSYNVPLSDYVRGDPSGKRFIADIWWYIHFFNRWGTIQQKRPENVLILRYEDLLQDPATALSLAARHWGLHLSPPAIDAAMPYASRKGIAEKLDPAFGETVIPAPSAKRMLGFANADHDFIDDMFAKHLRHSLGYDLRTSSFRVSR